MSSTTLEDSWPDDLDADLLDADIVEQLPWLDTMIDLTTPSIRLLILRAGSDWEPIKCDLLVASLDDYPVYEALSYVWGDAEITTPIEVGGQTFDPTLNLRDFLHCLRKPDRDRVVWADAICINQKNFPERNHQLGLMARVYQQANDVHVWFGPFTVRWQEDIAVDEFVPSSKMAEPAWWRLEQRWLDQLAEYERYGGQVVRSDTIPDHRRCDKETVMDDMLRILEQIARGKHLWEFPIYHCDNPRERAGVVRMNRYWVVLLDCMRWFASRPWWYRVWTLQEAVLPLVIPTVHIGPRQVPLSILSEGISSMVEHSLECCHKMRGAAGGYDQGFPIGKLMPARAVDGHRKIFAQSAQPYITVGEAISATRTRKATDLRDHFFGMLGLMPQEYRQHFQEQGYSSSEADIYAQCSKLLYATDERGLGLIASARAMRESAIENLPSWSYDLATRDDDIHESEEHWRCYQAGQETEYRGAKRMDELLGSVLTVEGVFVGKVQACVRRLSTDELENSRSSEVVAAKIKESLDLYRSQANRYNNDIFWRTMFMDRNIWQYWRHDRKPLPPHRINDIKKWWDSYDRSGDYRDLTMERGAARPERGTFHYRAAKLCMQNTRFFCTAKGEPGYGPHDLQPSDQIYLLAGCPALAFIRRTRGMDGKAKMMFVGLGYVDGYMYGEGVRGDPLWQQINLH